MILAIKSDCIDEAIKAFAPNVDKELKSAHHTEIKAACERLAAYMEDDYSNPTGAIAIMPFFGMCTQHRSWWGVSTELFGRALDKVVNSANHAQVVIEFHSPGGQAWGVAELAAKVRKATKKKKITGLINSQCASGAYWVASQCTELVITPGGEAGAIGVYDYRYEYDGMEQEAGIVKKIYSVPAKKAEIAGVAPTSPETDEELLQECQQIYDMFESAVAKGRNKTANYVRNNFGGGGVLLAKNAVEAGMADRIATKDELISEMVGSSGRKRSADANRRKIQLAEMSA